MICCQECGAKTGDELRDGRVRPVCIACGAVTYLDPKLAVAVLIERDGRLLLGRRAETARQSGKWSFPAGFVERGERVEDAAVREVTEEVGLVVAPGRLLGLFSSPGETVVVAVYEAHSHDGDPVAADDLDLVAWFDPRQLPDLAFPHDAEIVQRWLKAEG